MRNAFSHAVEHTNTHTSARVRLGSLQRKRSHGLSVETLTRMSFAAGTSRSGVPTSIKERSSILFGKSASWVFDSEQSRTYSGRDEGCMALRVRIHCRRFSWRAVILRVCLFDFGQCSSNQHPFFCQSEVSRVSKLRVGRHVV